MLTSKKWIQKGILFTTICVLGIAGTNYTQAKQTIKISKKKLTMTIGEKKKLSVINAKKVTWKSKNPSIASVNQKGLISAKKAGTTKITALYKKKTFTCKVTVKKSTSSKDTFPNPQIIWENGEKSGTTEDFQKYFSVDMEEYTQAQENVSLGTVTPITYSSKVVGGDREAYVYLPPDYDAKKTYPVLYMIHGIGCTREQWYSMSLNKILSNMIAKGEVVPLVAVLPSVVPKDGLDKNTLSAANIKAYTDFEQEFLKDLEPYIKKNYSISEKAENTGVCGLSMGGMEALHLGFSIKNHFNYIGSFSAAPTLDQSLLTLKNWSYAPKVVMMCTGDKDNTVGENPYNYHMTLLKNHVEHIWYQYPDGTHSDPVWKNGLVNFLKKSF